MKVKIKLHKVAFYISLLIINSLVYVLSFYPSYAMPFLGMVSILSYTFIFASSTTFKQLLVYVFTAGCSVAILGCYWIFYASQYSLHNVWLSILIMFCFALIYSVFFLIVGLLIYYGKCVKIEYYWLLLALAWSCYDVIKYKFLGGFPWFEAAYWWYSFTEMKQIVAIIGVLGTSVVSYILIFYIYYAIKQSQHSILRCMLRLMLVGIVLVLVYSFGSQRIAFYDNEMLVKFKNINLVMLQPNIKQSNKDYFTYMYKTNVHMIGAIPNAVDNQLIILPETAFANLMLTKDQLENNLYLNNLITLLHQNQALLFGVIYKEHNRFYNSAYLLNQQRDDKIYHKQILVPFGEYIPYAEYIPFVSNVFQMLNFSKGNQQVIFQHQGVNFITLICFEAFFPFEMHNLKRVDVMINIANEAWFNHSIELLQNWIFLHFVSLETGRYIVKVANTGISGIISPIGITELKLSPNRLLAKEYTLNIKTMDVMFSYKWFVIMYYIIISLYAVVLIWVYRLRLSK